MNFIEQIARVCHEANREYCKTIGDDSQPTWEDAPDWQKQSALKGVAYHIENAATAKAEDSHVSWLKQKEEEGWVYGEEKDAEKKTHPCMVPFEELPQEQKVKDYIFRGIVHSFMDGGVIAPGTDTGYKTE